MNTTTSSQTQWHTLLGTLLERFLTPVGIEVSTNVEVMSSPPEADIVLLRRQGKHWSDDQKARLPDGIRDSDASHILIEFKYTQSFNELSLRQAVGYDYFYQLSKDLKRHEVQTVVVSSKTPQHATLKEFGYEPDGHPGVFRSRYALVKHALLLVANDLDDTPHNAPIKCFASRKPVKQRALIQLHNTTWSNTPTTFWWFLDGLLNYWSEQQGGENMQQETAVTPEFITQLGKQMVKQILSHASIEERLDGLKPEDLLKTVPHQELLKQLSPKERLDGLKPEDLLKAVPHQELLKQLSPEERLENLSISAIESYLEKQKQQKAKQAESQAADLQEDKSGRKKKK